MLGTPWHKDVNPSTDYDQNTVQVGKIVVIEKQGRSSEHEISHVPIRVFQKMLKKKGAMVYSCYTNSVGSEEQAFGRSTTDLEMMKIVQEYTDAFRSNLPDGATGELCIPRNFVKVVLSMAHDCPSSGHFGEAKTLDRLTQFSWKKKIDKCP